ncbi:transcriptional regulator [Rhodococcus sp. SRB_17]|uniref:helix-turn-helix domain-containing protein n=1 Tax=Rhodococcus sp. OK302 TaxID=1882769 RepID=UPI000B944B69|nr:helix-turn-helix transcriptional regulator [Rhodococcus sp. OK302]NMM86343.1 transcriptional regulator [Rhodococcus sp. SRB_17]OYD69758.1 helix-turn-helix protein [Rhodococcus sp. OK302]
MDEQETHRLTMGELIRRQRELAELPMRQLAAMVGISNPYLSQIERNLREPSDRVLRAIADNLQLSADALVAQTAQSGDDGISAVMRAIREDPDLTKAQRAAIEEMYQAFREVTVSRRKRTHRD